MRKLIAALAASVLALSSAVAQTVPPPTVAARSWMLLDATSGQIIASHDPDARIEPASLTKIMTAYLTFAALKEKKLTLNQMINVSVKAWKVDSSSSKMFIDPAVPVSVDDLLHGLMVQSGNDAAVALAEAVAGDESAFVFLMNREAQRMGLKNTRFANPHGLPHPDNFSTAHDLSVLAARVIADYPEFYKIDSVKSFTYNKITQPNRNRLLWLEPDGGRHENRAHRSGRVLHDRLGAPSQRQQPAPPDFGRARHKFRPGAHPGKPEAAELGLPEFRTRSSCTPRARRSRRRKCGRVRRIRSRSASTATCW